MIKLGEKIEFPSEWSELSTTQFLKVIVVLSELYGSENEIFDIQLKLFQILSGYKRSKKRFKDDQVEIINQNIVFLAQQIRFPFKFYYRDQSFFQLDPELKKKLRKHLPSEIYDSSIPGDLHPEFHLDLFWRENPVPSFRFKGKTYCGPVINIDKYNVLQTNLTAEQYADACGYYEIFLKTQDYSYLNLLLASLYLDKKFSTNDVYKNASELVQVHISIKITALYLIQNLQEFLVDYSGYKILYSRSKSDPQKISLGVESTILELAEAGYGTEETLAKTNLIKFLNMQMHKLKTFIAECRNLPMTDSDISSKFKIPSSTLKVL